MEYVEKLNGNAAPAHKGVLHCVLSNSPNVRRKCLVVLKRIVASLSGTSIARCLFHMLYEMLENIQVIKQKQKTSGDIYISNTFRTNLIKTTATTKRKRKTTATWKIICLRKF